MVNMPKSIADSHARSCRHPAFRQVQPAGSPMWLPYDKSAGRVERRRAGAVPETANRKVVPRCATLSRITRGGGDSMAARIAGFRLGIYVFKDVEIFDFAAPHGVFSVAR